MDRWKHGNFKKGIVFSRRKVNQKSVHKGDTPPPLHSRKRPVNPNKIEVCFRFAFPFLADSPGVSELVIQVEATATWEFAVFESRAGQYFCWGFSFFCFRLRIFFRLTRKNGEKTKSQTKSPPLFQSRVFLSATSFLLFVFFWISLPGHTLITRENSPVKVAQCKISPFLPFFFFGHYFKCQEVVPKFWWWRLGCCVMSCHNRYNPPSRRKSVIRPNVFFLVKQTTGEQWASKESEGSEGCEEFAKAEFKESRHCCSCLFVDWVQTICSENLGGKVLSWLEGSWNV